MNGKSKSLYTVAAIAVATAFVGLTEIRLSNAIAATPVADPKATANTPTIATTTPTSDLKRLNDTFTGLAAEVSPAVVSIYTKSNLAPKSRGNPREDDYNFYFGGPLPGPRGLPAPPREALGSGFVINAKEGYIVTNAHVVRTMSGRNADEIVVKFTGEENGKGHRAKVLGVDELSDVGLLQLVDKVEGLKAIALGDSDKAKVGEWVLAIGNPYGHDHTVTQGIVSAMGRALGGARNDFLQTSASINPGNSGGPLVNMDGEVIAINTAIDPRAQGIGFAIPINTAKKVIDQLVASGKVARAWLGISIAEVNEDVAGLMRLDSTEGVLVREVMPKQAAASAGIEPYDVIRKINGEEIKTIRDLYRSVEKLEVGQSATIEVLRGKQAKNLKVKMGEQPAA